jgi:hypothetical protein
MLPPCKAVGMSICFIHCVCYVNFSLGLVVVLLVLETTTSRLQEDSFQMQQISRDWMIEDTVSTNCGCPSRTLESP